MQTARLHPLVTLAAISLIVFSAVGIAALSGLMPASKGSSPLELPKEIVKPVEPAITHPVAVPKPVARKKAAPRPVQPIVFNDFEVQKPLAALPGITGTVEAVREIKTPGEARGVGAVAGGVAGAVLGHNIGNHNKLVTVLGTAGGALLGNHIEKQGRATTHWEISVRLDDGSTRTLTTDQPPYWHAGDRVRMVDGRLQPV